MSLLLPWKRMVTGSETELEQIQTLHETCRSTALISHLLCSLTSLLNQAWNNESEWHILCSPAPEEPLPGCCLQISALLSINALRWACLSPSARRSESFWLKQQVELICWYLDHQNQLPLNWTHSRTQLHHHFLQQLRRCWCKSSSSDSSITAEILRVKTETWERDLLPSLLFKGAASGWDC